MGYRHIDNLYKNMAILQFKECYALEKIHGTSAHIAWKNGELRFFSGGSTHSTFEAIFDQDELKKLFIKLGYDDIIIYGEAYGGKMQKMKTTYGDNLRFIAFEVKIDKTWLNVSNADDVVAKLDLEFVFWKKIPVTMEAINAERDADSVQAIRNLGIAGEGMMREGIVLRPLDEFRDNRENRIMSKHKRDEFMETRTPRQVDPEERKILDEANAIAFEWVTDMRLLHVLDKFPEDIDIKNTGDIITAMMEDILRESKGEIIDSKPARKAIRRDTARLFKKYLQKKLQDNNKDNN